MKPVDDETDDRLTIRPDRSRGRKGSAAWARLRLRLLESGLTEDDLARVVTPIGLFGLPGKDPATIAVSVAADLLLRMSAADRADAL